MTEGRLAFLCSLLLAAAAAIPAGTARGADDPVDAFRTDPARVPKAHPYLLGSLEDLRKLRTERAEDYSRTARVARDPAADEWPRALSLALVAAIEGDDELGREAVGIAKARVFGPIRSGHVPFGADLALSGLVYDLCHALWTPEERTKFHEYLNGTVDANVDSETHVFHNGWYGYKDWGVGIAAYASYHENPRAPEILAALERDYRERAAPALRLAGRGGGWAEGYYIHYWLYEWLFFLEVARRSGGPDYAALAPEFYDRRAVASMFEMVPGIREYGSRRPVPMGDGGGRVFGGDRDKALFAREILASRHPDDPEHRAVRAFDDATPRSSVGVYAYMDFLWRDRKIPAGDLRSFRLSHIAEGPGFVYARSSWDEDATYFFFRSGDRFTAHQHLDAGHFVIYKREELAGDAGHYDAFGSPHDVNFHLRTIAHSTILVFDPNETWPAIRAGRVTGNDGGQHHAWPHHNGAVADPAAWEAGRTLYDIADLLAFEDRGEYLYVAADATRAYAPAKLDAFRRQIVFLRPGTFVVFDRVVSKDPSFRKTWLLQAAKRPAGSYPSLAVANGEGRLYLEALLPRGGRLELRSGEDIYGYGGRNYPPARDTGPAPECRIEISPAEARLEDFFLNVLFAADSSSARPERPRVSERSNAISVAIGSARIEFETRRTGGSIETPSGRRRLAEEIVRD